MFPVTNIPVTQFIIQNSGFYIITQLYFQDIFQHFFNILVKNRTSGLYTMVKIAYHPVGRGNIYLLSAIIMKNKHPCMFKVLVNNTYRFYGFYELAVF